MKVQSDDPLIFEFCSEDTEEWSKAATEIGKLAVCQKSYLDFINSCLNSDQPLNHHRYRHAHCALASYLSNGGDQMIFSSAVDRLKKFFQWLVFLEIEKNERMSLDDFVKISGGQEWYDNEVKRIRNTLEKLRDSDKPNNVAIEINENRLQKLLNPQDLSVRDLGFKSGKSALGVFKSDADWVIASYLRGVSGDQALLSFPLDLVLSGLSTLAAEKEIAWVKNVPHVLKKLHKDSMITTFAEACTFSYWLENGDYWDVIELLQDLSDVKPDFDGFAYLLRENGFEELLKKHDFQNKKNWKYPQLIKFIEVCQQKLIIEDWQWKAYRSELHPYILFLLVILGSTKKSPWGSLATLDLKIRRKILLQIIDKVENKNDDLLVLLVRALK
jgi:hypothetical protein